MNLRKTLRRWHIWLGWLVGVPLLFWTLSGFFMVLKPIEDVRGENLLSPEPRPQLERTPLLPVTMSGETTLELVQRQRGLYWVMNGDTLIEAAAGRRAEPFSAEDARAEVAARYIGTSPIASVAAIDPADPPLDWRRDTPAWKVETENGTRFYVERDTGRIAAVRTGWWRAFDFMWGVHIMDLQTREHISNNWVRAFSAISFASVLMALVLLPLSQRRRRRRG
ncbi:PepSY domain-containing protein [Sphingomicrobium sp. XHP0235]|uniref:PepSY domain-containing protein n=1 Tax=Sphingomicrobium aquimarinum TaxID=3133971 RepID=UPI0031FE666C